MVELIFEVQNYKKMLNDNVAPTLIFGFLTKEIPDAVKHRGLYDIKRISYYSSGVAVIGCHHSAGTPTHSVIH